MMTSVATLRSTLQRLVSRRSVVPIDRCYHYRAFRYGGFGWNPYEDYVVGMVRNEDRTVLRQAFADAVLNCRPRNMGEAVQLDLADWTAWQFPWNHNPATTLDPLLAKDNPDILCHSSVDGVLSSHINREFRWLEGAFENIRKSGYRPRMHGFIRCLELVHRDRSSYLVLDGNHRLSALHALGEQSVEIETCLQKVRREDAHKWPDVRNGRRTLADAVRLFDRYFHEQNAPLGRLHPARLIIDEPPQWL